MRFLGILMAGVLSGCAVQLADPIVPATKALPAADVVTQASNELENYLIITRVSAFPSLVATGESSVLTVEFQEALGRTVSSSWSCDKGTLVADKGQRTIWQAPDEPGICECEAVVKSKSGQVRGLLRITVR